MHLNRPDFLSLKRLRGVACVLNRKARTALRCTLWRLRQDLRVRANRLALLVEECELRLGLKRAEFRIWGWYGRTGNNVQQLIVAIAHAEVFHGKTGIDAEQVHSGPLRDILQPLSWISQG